MSSTLGAVHQPADTLALHSVDELLSEVRQGRMVVLLDDNSERGNEGVLMVAAEHCTAEHITLMARKARGLVCLGLSAERCRQLDLPPMVDRAGVEGGSFRLSIEAATGIDTGISAADRAHTVRVAVAPHATPADLVQPGHIFPLQAAPGGVLSRAGHTEAAVDYARLAGLLPAAVITDILSADGELADGRELHAFAREHGLAIGSVAQLIQYRMLNERTIECLRSGPVRTVHGDFTLSLYRDNSTGEVHVALHCGEIRADQPTPVRVHARAALRDLLGTDVPGSSSWRLSDSLRFLARAGKGVLVLLAREESEAQLLHSVDRVLGSDRSAEADVADTYNTVGLGSQILRDLGVGRIALLGAPVKYNALSGFGLEVVEYIAPPHSDRGAKPMSEGNPNE